MDHASASSSVAGTVAHICSRAGILIDGAVARGKRLPITKLSEELSAECETDKVFCYHIITKYISARGDLVVRMGPGGGITMKGKDAQDLHKEHSRTSVEQNVQPV